VAAGSDQQCHSLRCLLRIRRCPFGPRSRTGSGYQAEPERTAVRRPIHDRMLTGVAIGLAGYVGVDVMIVRVAFVVLTVVAGAGIPLYLAGLLLIP